MFLFNEIYYISQGTSVRFGDFQYSPIPGPGNYKIEGFADDLLKKNSKLFRNRIDGQNSSKENSLDKRNSIDKIEENQNEYEN